MVARATDLSNTEVESKARALNIEAARAVASLFELLPTTGWKVPIEPLRKDMLIGQRRAAAEDARHRGSLRPTRHLASPHLNATPHTFPFRKFVVVDGEPIVGDPIRSSAEEYSHQSITAWEALSSPRVVGGWLYGTTHLLVESHPTWRSSPEIAALLDAALRPWATELGLTIEFVEG